MVTGVLTGELAADSWTRVLSGWGYFSVEYGISVSVPGGRYRCYTAPLPWPWSSGDLPNPQVTHRVIGYGDVWLHVPAPATYRIVPVFPPV